MSTFKVNPKGGIYQLRNGNFAKVMPYSKAGMQVPLRHTNPGVFRFTDNHGLCWRGNGRYLPADADFHLDIVAPVKPDELYRAFELNTAKLIHLQRVVAEIHRASTKGIGTL